MIRRSVQRALGGLGYQLVPLNRHAQSAMRFIEAQSFDTVFDVGANVGTTCEHWLSAFPKATVHAFEPMPSALAQLRKLEPRWGERLVIWPVAASSQSGVFDFEVQPEHESSSSLMKRTEDCAQLLPFTQKTETIQVRADPIDSILPTVDVAKLGKGFMKLDVQGHELEVLQGATETLKHCDYVLAELNLLPLYEGQPGIVGIADFLSRHDFDFFGFVEQFHLEDGTPVYADLLFKRRS